MGFSAQPSARTGRCPGRVPRVATKHISGDLRQRALQVKFGCVLNPAKIQIFTIEDKSAGLREEWLQ